VFVVAVPTANTDFASCVFLGGRSPCSAHNPRHTFEVQVNDRKMNSPCNVFSSTNAYHTTGNRNQINVLTQVQTFQQLRRMASSGMLCRVALLRTDVSAELSASFIRVTRIGELGTTLAVTSNRFVFLRSMRRSPVTATAPSTPILVTLMMEVLSSSETSVLTRSTWRNIPEDGILQCTKDLNISYMTSTLQKAKCVLLYWSPV
jgi:hypothetical protein